MQGSPDNSLLMTGYAQVIGSFVTYKVEWPSFLGSCISWVQNVAALFKFDMLEIPGLACVWASVSYTDKAYVKVRLS